MVDFVHEALLYRDAEQFLAGTVPFVRDGLEAGEAVLVAVPGTNLDLLRGALGRPGDHVEFLDMEVAGRNPGRIIPGVLAAFTDNARGGRVRIIGEPIWAGRTELEYPACVQHEALINTAFEERPARILCPYDTSALDADVLRDAEATHPVVVEDLRRRASNGYREPFLTADDFNRPLPAPPPDAITHRFDLDGLVLGRRMVASFAMDAGLSEDQVEDLVIAVNELATNSVVYAGGAGTLLLWRDGPTVVCEVRDQGRMDDPMLGRRNPGPAARGGYGVMLVNLLCDLVRVHTHEHGTSIRVFVSAA
ncbi:anti-sigma regulatory factor (Ser/Thr protein kinase) [Saccharothrix tamanrassetensis]|uniref:Anti-sigma regulatory factor (Ser/Thr protein kinase) n=1 Tax=Saccharothrix tamanrassetensis TaxID=1051531 RepID=A0A841CKV8_9PSEU|nr:sensor histidine kinase [Saccharothrix tamanrassetensis]MBB5956808.1 anti-sigma regulatory factor (Ser/Thr protein kinase) [Saccharothrix tamanrassetensis]